MLLLLLTGTTCRVAGTISTDRAGDVRAVLCVTPLFDAESFLKFYNLILNHRRTLEWSIRLGNVNRECLLYPCQNNGLMSGLLSDLSCLSGPIGLRMALGALVGCSLR